MIFFDVVFMSLILIFSVVLVSHFIDSLIMQLKLHDKVKHESTGK
jgi:hypothetical protein